MQLLLLHRLASVFAFNVVLSFKRQPYIMNEPIGWLIFGHKLLCRELDDTECDLPVCLDMVRSRVLKEVINILGLQQLLEMLSWRDWLVYCKQLLARRLWPDAITPAAIQVTKAPAYAGEDLNGASSRNICFQHVSGSFLCSQSPCPPFRPPLHQRMCKSWRCR